MCRTQSGPPAVKINIVSPYVIQFLKGDTECNFMSNMFFSLASWKVAVSHHCRAAKSWNCIPTRMSHICCLMRCDQLWRPKRCWFRRLTAKKRCMHADNTVSWLTCNFQISRTFLCVSLARTTWSKTGPVKQYKIKASLKTWLLERPIPAQDQMHLTCIGVEFKEPTQSLTLSRFCVFNRPFRCRKKH